MGSIIVNHRKQNRFIEQPRQEINKDNAEQEKQLAEDVQNLSKKVCSSVLSALAGNSTVCVLRSIVI